MPKQSKHGPITDEEALAAVQKAARANNETRIARAASKLGKTPDELTEDELATIPLNEIPEALDPHAKEMFSLRIPQTLLAKTRAKVEIEDGNTITNVIVEALTAYVQSEPGTEFHMRTPRD
ncbi:hypothetical protein M3A88_09815 [Kocuria marina]|uniref:hypothetical protein n=1 Tax=Kocuria marina TaxID=223184 RepID=UPI00298A0684|nr:hypothetical protein [Kocuria marina]MCT1735531.1 hypothetical protein [Kocuria marina]